MRRNLLWRLGVDKPRSFFGEVYRLCGNVSSGNKHPNSGNSIKKSVVKMAMGFLKKRSRRAFFYYFKCDGAEYLIHPPIVPDCVVKEGNREIAYFETMNLNGSVLHVDHFALSLSQVGNRRADEVLRGFANLVSRQLPEVDVIAFDLFRCGSSSDIYKLAKARASLLERIGATDIRRFEPNNDRIVVSGKWEKISWTTSS